MKKVAAQRAKHQAQLRHFEKPHHARAAVEAMRPVPIAAAPKAPIAVTPTSPSTPAVQRTAQPLSLAQRLGGSRPQLNMVSSIKHRFLRTIGTTASAPHFGFRASELPAVGSGAEAAPRLFAFAHL